jgi:hypothetical protein
LFGAGVRDRAAELAEALGVPLRDVERVPRPVEPYIAHGGIHKWPLRELARVLADTGRVVPSALLGAPGHEQARRRRQRYQAKGR